MRRKEIAYVARCDENTCNSINEKIKAIIKNGGGLVKETEMWESKLGKRKCSLSPKNINPNIRHISFCRFG